SVLFPVDSGPKIRIRLGICISFGRFDPREKSHGGKNGENEVLKRCQNQTFVEVERNGNQVRQQPKIPVFHFFLSHQPHSHKGRSGGKRIPLRDVAIGEIFEQV